MPVEHKKIYISMAVTALVVVVGVYAFFYYSSTMGPVNNKTKPITKNPSTNTACDADARQCPDGTVVGRVAPSCDFAPCPNAVVREQVQLQGTYVCLPHKNSSGVQTDECQGGIKTANGKYYSLDFGFMSQTSTMLVVGDQFGARGMLTPIEMLSSNFLRDNYIVEGVFSVTDSVIKF